MRALVLRDFYDIAVEERPDPVPGSGQAVVEVIATGILKLSPTSAGPDECRHPHKPGRHCGRSLP
jgi:hypothetical protein